MNGRGPTLAPISRLRTPAPSPRGGPTLFHPRIAPEGTTRVRLSWDQLRSVGVGARLWGMQAVDVRLSVGGRVVDGLLEGGREHKVALDVDVDEAREALSCLARHDAFECRVVACAEQHLDVHRVAHHRVAERVQSVSEGERPVEGGVFDVNVGEVVVELVVGMAEKGARRLGQE